MNRQITRKQALKGTERTEPQDTARAADGMSRRGFLGRAGPAVLQGPAAIAGQPRQPPAAAVLGDRGIAAASRQLDEPVLRTAAYRGGDQHAEGALGWICLPL